MVHHVVCNNVLTLSLIHRDSSVDLITLQTGQQFRAIFPHQNHSNITTVAIESVEMVYLWERGKTTMMGLSWEVHFCYNTHHFCTV